LRAGRIVYNGPHMTETTTSATVKRDWTPFYIPASVIIAGLIIAGAVFVTSGSRGAAVGPDGTPTATVDINDVDISGAPYIGEENAPVTMAFWTDYQCPFCKAVEVGHDQIPTEPALPVLIDKYVKTGKLKIVFMDFSFLGPDSDTAALYGRSIWALYPAQYFEWRTAMYEAQDEEHGGFGDAASIDKLIKGTFPGIDVAKVKADIAANKSAYEAAIAANRAEGAKFGVNGTPGSIIGAQLISGAQGPDAFTAAVEAAM